MIAALLAACGAFLLAVLWMDLLFDVQARRLASPESAAGAAALASIAAYYRRVTTDAFPMNRLIGAVMLLQLAGIGYEVSTRIVTGWRALAVVVLGVAPVVLALVRVFPDAVRLGGTTDPTSIQADLARRIYRAHVVCFAAIAGFTLLQLRLAG